MLRVGAKPRRGGDDIKMHSLPHHHHASRVAAVIVASNEGPKYYFFECPFSAISKRLSCDTRVSCTRRVQETASGRAKLHANV